MVERDSVLRAEREKLFDFVDFFGLGVVYSRGEGTDIGGDSHPATVLFLNGRITLRRLRADRTHCWIIICRNIQINAYPTPYYSEYNRKNRLRIGANVLIGIRSIV